MFWVGSGGDVGPEQHCTSCGEQTCLVEAHATHSQPMWTAVSAAPLTSQTLDQLAVLCIKSCSCSQQATAPVDGSGCVGCSSDPSVLAPSSIGWGCSWCTCTPWPLQQQPTHCRGAASVWVRCDQQPWAASHDLQPATHTKQPTGQSEGCTGGLGGVPPHPSLKVLEGQAGLRAQSSQQGPLHTARLLCPCLMSGCPRHQPAKQGIPRYEDRFDLELACTDGCC